MQQAVPGTALEYDEPTQQPLYPRKLRTVRAVTLACHGIVRRCRPWRRNGCQRELAPPQLLTRAGDAAAVAAGGGRRGEAVREQIGR